MIQRLRMVSPDAKTLLAAAVLISFAVYMTSNIATSRMRGGFIPCLNRTNQGYKTGSKGDFESNFPFYKLRAVFLVFARKMKALDIPVVLSSGTLLGEFKFAYSICD